MTEAEWNACTEPCPMLDFLRGKASDRKLRLFAVACCRRIWHLMTDERSRRAVKVAERYADGMATNTQRRAAALAAAAVGGKHGGAASFAVSVPAHDAAERALEHAALSIGYASTKIMDTQWGDNRAYFAAVTEASAGEHIAQIPLLHDIFGPLLFRPVALDPSWLTSSVKQLAEATYEEKIFHRMPILGDALEEAGCTDAGILNHCRQPGKHVKGCWVVDLLLGKS